METLESDRMREQHKRDIMREVEADSIVQSLDAELHQLIQVGRTRIHTGSHMHAYTHVHMYTLAHAYYTFAP